MRYDAATGSCFSMEQPEASEPLEMFVRTYGADEGLAGRLIEHTAAWDRAGRPSTGLRGVRAYPIDTDYSPAANETIIPKRWTKLVLDWQDSSMSPAADSATQGDIR